METLKEIAAIISTFSPFFWYWLGHTHGYRWTLKNPGKDHIEYFFEVEKQNKEPEDERSVARKAQ